MATLYVRDIPDELYEQLKKQAQREGRSITAETIVLLRHALGPGPEAQRAILDRIALLPKFDPETARARSSTELLREDRAR